MIDLLLKRKIKIKKFNRIINRVKSQINKAKIEFLRITININKVKAQIKINNKWKSRINKRMILSKITMIMKLILRKKRKAQQAKVLSAINLPFSIISHKFKANRKTVNKNLIQKQKANRKTKKQ